jgi:hypothetical protein
LDFPPSSILFIASKGFGECCTTETTSVISRKHNIPLACQSLFSPFRRLSQQEKKEKKKNFPSFFFIWSHNKGKHEKKSTRHEEIKNVFRRRVVFLAVFLFGG